MKAINNKIESLNKLQAEIKQVENERYNRDFNEPFPFELYEKQERLENKFNAGVRQLAKTLGFVIKPNNLGFRKPDYNNAFECMKSRWEAAMKELHCLYIWAEEYIDNAPTEE